MSYQVTLKASGKQFTVQEDETLLEAALQQGITLPYGCKNGACGSCKGKILEGQVEHGQHSAAALSPADEATGGTLFCCAHPKSDLLIEAREVQGAGDIDHEDRKAFRALFHLVDGGGAREQDHRQKTEEHNGQGRDGPIFISAPRRLAIKMGRQSLEIERPQEQSRGQLLHAIDEDEKSS